MEKAKYTWQLETVRYGVEDKFILDGESESLFDMTDELRRRLLKGRKRLSLILELEGWRYFADVEKDGKSLRLPDRFFGYGRVSNIRVPQGFHDLLKNAQA